MNNVFALSQHDDGCPLRETGVRDVDFLVSIFKHERELLPFVRFLFNEYGIVTVRQYDAAKISPFKRFKLDGKLEKRFKAVLGRPMTTGRERSAEIVTFQPRPA